MPYKWTKADFARFDAAMEKLDFGNLDRAEIEYNSLNNAADVAPEDDPVGVAIRTAEDYIDQGVSSF